MRRAGGVVMAVTALVFAASALTFGATVLDAVRVEGPSVAATPAGAPEETDVAGPSQGTGQTRGERSSTGEVAGRAPEPAGESLAGIIYPRVTEDEILDAINHDPFQPDRTPPPERYVPPGARAEPETAARDDRRQRGPELRVVGAVVMGDQLALAMVQVDDSVPLALLLGESVEGYTLAAVDGESATLVGADETLTLPVVEAIHSASSTAQSARGRTQNNARDMEALQTRVQEMIRNLQQQRGMMGRGGGGQIPGTAINLRPLEIVQPGIDVPLTGRVIVRPRGGGGGGGLNP